MKKIELRQASKPLSEYARRAKKNPIVVVKDGRPVAAVVPVLNADMETVSLSTNRKFLNNKIRVIQRRGYGLRDEEYLRLKVLTCMLPEI